MKNGDEDGHLRFEVTRCMFLACLLCQQEALHRLWYLGPLHTQAKSRDHEIVRAQESVQMPSHDTSKIM